MIKVKVRLYSVLREIAGTSTLQLAIPDKGLVKDVLEKIVQEFKQGFQDRYRLVGDENILNYFLVFVNDMPIYRLRGLDTPVGEGDVLDILEPVSGG